MQGGFLPVRSPRRLNEGLALLRTPSAAGQRKSGETRLGPQAEAGRRRTGGGRHFRSSGLCAGAWGVSQTPGSRSFCQKPDSR